MFDDLTKGNGGLGRKSVEGTSDIWVDGAHLPAHPVCISHGLMPRFTS